MTDTNAPLPLISVVVPSYNQAGFLRDTFASIFRQEYPRLEVVVMDGGSTDGSVDIIREHAPRLKYWQSQKDGGQSAAINAGMSHCTGDVVGWLNSDDFFWGDGLWTLARAFRAHPGHGLYVGNGLRYVQSDRRYYPFCTRHVAFGREALLRGVDSVLQPATFFLREAWDAVGGLKNELRFCMDWDIYLRIAQKYPVVVINDFLAVSREYEDTKTRSGKMDRAAEIVRMVRQHTGEEVTPGTLVYLFETLRDVTDGVTYPEVRPCVRRAHEVLAFQVSQTFGGGGHPFPEWCDSNDHVLSLLPREGEPVRPFAAGVRWPSLSVVCRVEDVPGGRLAAESVLRQGYPSVELLFVGPSAVVEELARSHPGSSAVGCDPSINPARSLNQALAAATGDVLTWLEPEEALTQGALAEVGRAFAADLSLDAVVGNALYVDAEGRPILLPAGRFRSALSVGAAPGCAGLKRYWLLPSLSPPAGLFFRRGTVGPEGGLDDTRLQSYAHEFLANLVRLGKVNKLERTQVLRHRPFGPGLVEAELYARGRPHWGSEGLREFLNTWRSFVGWYMRRHFTGAGRGLRFWFTAGLTGLSSLLWLGNPETFVRRTPPFTGPRPSPTPKPTTTAVSRSQRHRVRVTACLTAWPDDVRQRLLLREMTEFAHLECFLLRPGPADADVIHTPETLRQTRPKLVRRPRLLRRLLDGLRRLGVPVPGPQTPVDVTEHLRILQSGMVHLLQLTLQREAPDVLLVGAEDNPAAGALQVEHPRTRLVLLARRVGLSAGRGLFEAGRAERFERKNLALYDGVIVPSAADRDALVAQHGFSPDRVAVLTVDGDVEFLDGGSRRGLKAWWQLLGKLPRRGNATSPDLPVLGPAVRDGTEKQGAAAA